MPLGIDPKVDFAFKLVFGSPDHTPITIHFLNAVLNLLLPITWVEILNPIQGQDRSEDKLVVLDVLATDAEGRRFNIEMQTTLPIDLPKRLTYYNCVNYVRQLGQGDAYLELRPSINICVLDRELFPEVAEFHLSFRIRCDQRDLVFSDDLLFHTLELPKYETESHNTTTLGPLEKWLYFLKQAEHLSAEQLSDRLVDDAYGEAAGVLEMISKSPEDRQFYEARLKFLHDEQARLLAAREEGRAQGHAEGREEGRAEGQLVGKIQLLQQLLGEEPASTAQLLQLSSLELNELFLALQERLRTRGR